MVLYRCDCCGKETIKSDLIHISYTYHDLISDFGIDSGDICTSCASEFSKKIFNFKRDIINKCQNETKGN